jgi:hypothetical protein
MVPTPKRWRSGSFSGIAAGASTLTTAPRNACASSARPGTGQTGSKAANAATKMAHFIHEVDSPCLAKILMRVARQNRLPWPLGLLRPPDGSGIFMCS